MKLFGKYTKYGYKIWSDEKQDTIYQAGNSRYDSSQYVKPDRPDAVSLESLAEYCEDTGKEMAEEQGAKWLGCEYDQDGEAEITSMLDAEREPEQKRTALDVCKEFVADVDVAVYEDEGPHSALGLLWPDLLVTYEHAKEVVASALAEKG